MPFAIQRQNRSGHRARAQRTNIQPLAAVAQPIDVAQKHLDIRQQPMRNQHRLGALQMRVRPASQLVARRLRACVHEFARARTPTSNSAESCRRSARAHTAADRSQSARCGCGRCAACIQPRRQSPPADARRNDAHLRSPDRRLRGTPSARSVERRTASLPAPRWSGRRPSPERTRAPCWPQLRTAAGCDRKETTAATARIPHPAPG